MNKKKIVFAMISFMMLFLLSPNVKAANAITAYGQCVYTVSKGSTDIASKYISGTSLSFYFTEASLTKDKTTGKLFIYDSEYKTYSTMTGLGPAKGYGLSSTASVVTSENAGTTFKSSYEENSGNCPKNFLLKKSGDSKSEYIPYFTNGATTEYCNSDNGNCLVTAALSGTGATVKVYPTEKTWNFTASGEGSCANANVTISMDSKGKLLGSISYPKSSPYYEKSAKKTVTVDVNMTNEDSYLQFGYIEDLARNGHIAKLFIRGDSGNEKVYFNDSGFSSQSCTFESGTTTTVAYTCTTYDSIKATINSNESTALAAASGVDTVGDKYLVLNRATSKYSATKYSNETDATKLLNISKEINTAIGSSTFVKASTTYTDYLNGLISGGTLCTDASAQVAERLASYGTQAATKSQKVAALQETINNISARLTELGETDKAAEAKGYADAAGAFSAEITTVSKKATASSLLGDANFNMGSLTNAVDGCGMISTDMQEFLQTILDYIRIVGIILAVVLGIIDYIKAIFGSDEKSMAKANKSFATRLIAVALLFLIPAILEFILGLFNVLGSGVSGTCGVK